jgi:hypothetical protein
MFFPLIGIERFRSRKNCHRKTRLFRVAKQFRGRAATKKPASLQSCFRMLRLRPIASIHNAQTSEYPPIGDSAIRRPVADDARQRGSIQGKVWRERDPQPFCRMGSFSECRLRIKHMARQA